MRLCIRKEELAAASYFLFATDIRSIAALVEKCLDERIGIKADISLGFAGTGIGSDPNTYIEKATGRRLSHAEVLQRIRTYNGY